MPLKDSHMTDASDDQVKRSRGRPKKTETLLASDNLLPINSVIIGLDSEIKKTRGRPKKIITDIESPSDLIIEPPVNTQKSASLVPLEKTTELPILDKKASLSKPIPNNNNLACLHVLVSMPSSKSILDKKQNLFALKDGENDIQTSEKVMVPGIKNNNIEDLDTKQVLPMVSNNVQLPKESKVDMKDVNKTLPNISAELVGEQPKPVLQSTPPANPYLNQTYHQELNPLIVLNNKKAAKKDKGTLYDAYKDGYRNSVSAYQYKKSNEMLLSLAMLGFAIVCLFGALLFFLSVSQPGSVNLNNSSINFEQLKNDLKQSLTKTYHDVSTNTEVIVADTTKTLTQTIEQNVPIVQQRSSNSENLPLDGVTNFNNSKVINAVDSPTSFNWAAGNLDLPWNGDFNSESKKILLALRDRTEVKTKIQILVYPTKDNEKNYEQTISMAKEVYNEFINLGFKAENLSLIPPAIYLETNQNTLDVAIVHIIWI